MPGFTVTASGDVSDVELLKLYAAVEWTAYTREPEVLSRAIRNSAFVATARSGSGELIGLARAVSDDETICYLQDILVRPYSQRRGVGRALLECLIDRYAHVRQLVLIADDGPAQRAFYESLGFTEGSAATPRPVLVFARLQ